VGAPASGKSTWAKSEIAKDPNNWCRINNDDLRAMLNGSVWSSDYEKMITDTRNYLIRDALKRGKNIVIDNVNANRRHFDDVCKIAKSVNVNAEIFEKPFYEELDVLLARDAQRTGKSQVGEAVVKKWFKELGGKQHKFYKAKKEIIITRTYSDETKLLKQDVSLPKAAIFDLDGTMCEISHRNPYDASNCEKDGANDHVVNLCKMFYEQGIKIMFFSGREDKYKEQTEIWLKEHFGNEYELHMRKSSDMRKDSIIKQELYEAYAKDRYYLVAVVDDRLQVCQLWHKLGLPLFRVGNPDANF
jgi:predicted kinase